MQGPGCKQQASTGKKVALHAFVCVALLAAVNAVVAMSTATALQLALFSRLMLGPAEGWRIAFNEHRFPQALQLLVPVTGFCLWQLILYARRRTWSAAAVATVTWFASGYLYCIALWV